MARYRAQTVKTAAQVQRKDKKVKARRWREALKESLRHQRATSTEVARVWIASGLLPLLALVLLTPALDGVLGLSPSLTVAGTLLVAAPPLLFLLALWLAEPWSRIALPWAALNVALVAARLCGAPSAVKLFVPLVRFGLTANRAPEAVRLTWRLLRRVDDDPPRPISDKARVEAWKAARAARAHDDLPSPSAADTDVPRSLALLNPYATLQLPSDATDKEIRREWRAISLHCHPDKLARRRPPLKPAEAEQLLAHFLEAKAAYEVIGEPTARACYDAAVLRAQHGLRAAAFARAAVQQVVESDVLRRAETRSDAELVANELALGVLLVAVLQWLLLTAARSFEVACEKDDASAVDVIKSFFGPGGFKVKPSRASESWQRATTDFFFALSVFAFLLVALPHLFEKTMRAALRGPQARYSGLRSLLVRLESRLALSDPDLDPDVATKLRTRQAAKVNAYAGAWSNAAGLDEDGDPGLALAHRRGGNGTSPPNVPMKPRQRGRVVNDDGSVTYKLAWQRHEDAHSFMLCLYGTDATSSRRVLWQGHVTEAVLMLPPPEHGAVRELVLYPRLVAINLAGESCPGVPCMLRGSPPSVLHLRAQPQPQRSAEEREADAAAAQLRDESYAVRRCSGLPRVCAALAALESVAAAQDAKSRAVAARLTDMPQLVARLTTLKRALEAEPEQEPPPQPAVQQPPPQQQQQQPRPQPQPPEQTKPQPQKRAAAPAKEVEHETAEEQELLLRAVAMRQAAAAEKQRAAPAAATQPRPQQRQQQPQEAPQTQSRRQLQRQQQRGVVAEPPKAMLPDPVPLRVPIPAPALPKASSMPPAPPAVAEPPSPHVTPWLPPWLELMQPDPPPVMPLIQPLVQPAAPQRTAAASSVMPPPPPAASVLPPFIALPIPLPLPPAPTPPVSQPVPLPSAPQPPREQSPPPRRDEKLLCVICCEAERKAVLLPCRHFCLCAACVTISTDFYKRTPQPEAAVLFRCPVCSAAVQSTMSLFT